MSAEKRRARNDTIARFDDTLNALRSYIERYPDSEERVRLLGAEPALRDVRYSSSARRFAAAATGIPRWIANKCGVSAPFVLKLRDEHVTVTGSPAGPREGQDGKTRKVPERRGAPEAES